MSKTAAEILFLGIVITLLVLISSADLYIFPNVYVRRRYWMKPMNMSTFTTG